MVALPYPPGAHCHRPSIRFLAVILLLHPNSKSGFFGSVSLRHCPTSGTTVPARSACGSLSAGTLRGRPQARADCRTSIIAAEVNGNGKESDEDGILTTEVELAVFDYVRTRLSFLVDSEQLFNAISRVGRIDRKTVFIVFYRQERKGRLFNFREGTSVRYRFEFPDLDETIETDDLQAIDKPLLQLFKRRVAELG